MGAGMAGVKVGIGRWAVVVDEEEWWLFFS